jgi:hypothetical protein
MNVFLKSTLKDEFFYTRNDLFYSSKVKSNLLEQSSAIAWILDLEFKKMFLIFPGRLPTRYALSFLIFKKSLKFDGV